MSALATEVAKFRHWACVRQSPDHPCGQYSHGAEWECDYPEWHSFYAAVDSFLESVARRTLAADELQLLLYALARDNEDEVVLERLEEFAAVALQVAEAALRYPDTDARWQAAVLVGRLGTPDATALLRRFLSDDAEYVRRRAGFALQELETRT